MKIELAMLEYYLAYRNRRLGVAEIDYIKLWIQLNDWLVDWMIENWTIPMQDLHRLGLATTTTKHILKYSHATYKKQSSNPDYNEFMHTYRPRRLESKNEQRWTLIMCVWFRNNNFNGNSFDHVIFQTAQLEQKFKNCCIRQTKLYWNPVLSRT